MKFTLLGMNQLGFQNQPIQVIKNYGRKVAATDLALLFGCFQDKKKAYTTDEEPACYQWTKSSPWGNWGVVVLASNGETSYSTEHCDDRFGIRPLLIPEPKDSIYDEDPRSSDALLTAHICGCELKEYGEYPQTVADKRTSKKLEELFCQNLLKTTGKNYTFDTTNHADHDRRKDFVLPQLVPHSEFVYQGKKYVRVWANPYKNYIPRLSSGEKVKPGKPYWVQVEPIQWLKDPSGIWLSQKCLLSGLPFSDHTYPGANTFDHTYMNDYLNEKFAEDINPSNVAENEQSKLKAVLQSKTLTAIKRGLQNLFKRQSNNR